MALLLSEVLSQLVLRQLKQAGRPGGTLTQTVKHPYVFKGVAQSDDVSNMKMISRNINIPLSLAYPIFLRRVLSWCQAQPYFQELLSSVLANWHSETANRLCTAKPANKGELGAKAIQHVKI